VSERKPKRARKKEHRDQALAEALTAYRRRRMAMIGAVAIAVLGVAGVLIYTATAGDDDGGGRAGGGENAAGPCPSVEQPPSNPKQYDSPPPLEVQRGVDYGALIETSCGNLEIDLLEGDSPKTVANFVFLANEGFYDGLTWHRVERDLVIQGGDPQGNGIGGPGYSIPDELPAGPEAYVYGVVGMAKSAQPNSAGSQFFVVVHDAANRDDPSTLEPAGFPPSYAVFGRVSEDSYQTLEKIRKVPVRGGADQATAARPVTPVYIETIQITRD
jgi:cyclophilin family peptidyl-prolyl cis-trans isomerase